VRLPVSSRLAPAAGILAFLLAVPVSGFGQRGVQSSNVNQGAGRGGAGGAATTAATQGKAPAQPAQGQQSPRPTPTAERFLGWNWWNDDEVKKECKLTDMQVRQIQQIFDRRVRDLTPTYDEYVKQRAELDRLTKERVVDEKTYEVQVGRTQYLLSKLNETRTVMLYTMYRRLDPKQYEALKAIRDRRFGRGGGAPPPRTW